MKAVVCKQLGDPRSHADSPLQYVLDHPRPMLSPKDVRISVRAVGLNFADALMIQGQYQEKPKLPFVPGSECSGIVLEVGPQVKNVRPGDKVIAVAQNRCLAEECCVNCASVYRLPDGVDLESAAGLPVAFGTSHLALRERAHIREGHCVLVLGAAGGVGLAAVQIAKACGCVVVAVARGSTKKQQLEDLGADVVIDSQHMQEPLHKVVKAAVPKGVDVLYDPVGGDAFEAGLKCMRWGGHVLVIGFASGRIPQIPANIALVKNLTIHGIYWGSYMLNNPAVLQRSMAELLQWLKEGKIRVHVSHRFAMRDTLEAFCVLLSREVVGKVLILNVNQSDTARL